MQKEVYDEDQLRDFITSSQTKNHFEYIIDRFETCRRSFNHQPCIRRSEQNEKFRAATGDFLRQTHRPFPAQQQGHWPSARMAAQQPTLLHNSDAVAHDQGSSGGHYQGNEAQGYSFQTGVGGVLVASHGQAMHQNTHSFLRPQAASAFRAQNCSSQASMRSGASSTSVVDNDVLFPTPGTSQDGRLDIANATSSASSSLYLPPNAEVSKTKEPPQFEPAESILPDQRRPSAPHNIAMPVEPSFSHVATEPFVTGSMSWDGRVLFSARTAPPNFDESITHGHPGLHSTVDAYNSEGPESCDPSQYAWHYEYDNDFGSGSGGM